MPAGAVQIQGVRRRAGGAAVRGHRQRERAPDPDASARRATGGARARTVQRSGYERGERGGVDDGVASPRVRRGGGEAKRVSLLSALLRRRRCEEPPF